MHVNVAAQVVAERHCDKGVVERTEASQNRDAVKIKYNVDEYA